MDFDPTEGKDEWRVRVDAVRLRSGGGERGGAGEWWRWAGWAVRAEEVWAGERD